MTVDDIKTKVLEYLDEQVAQLSQVEYLEFLDDLASDLEIRAEAVREELELD